MIEFVVLILGMAIGVILFASGFLLCHFLRQPDRLTGIGRKATDQIDQTVDHFTELHRIISDLVDGKD